MKSENLPSCVFYGLVFAAAYKVNFEVIAKTYTTAPSWQFRRLVFDYLMAWSR